MIRRRRTPPLAAIVITLSMVAYVATVTAVAVAALLAPFALLRYIIG